MIKTFRGILADGEQNKIRLSTKKGKIGYKIIKFQCIPETVASGSNEGLIVISKVPGTGTPPTTLDLSDGNVLGAILWLRDQGTVAITSKTIIFDQEVFNQDIFVNYEDAQGSSGRMNYYIELETFIQTDNQAAVSTLRDIRLNPQVGA